MIRLFPATQAANTAGPFNSVVYRWLGALARLVNLGTVPILGIIFVNLTSSEISDEFDGTGLGNSGGKFDGWAICNGNNDTPDLSDRFIRSSTSGAGATGGKDTSTTVVGQNGTGASVTVNTDSENRPAFHELVPIMRLNRS